VPPELDVVRDAISAALPGAEVDVEDMTGGGDHLRATVTAPQFTGLTRIAQHRLVYAAVQDRLDDGSIHALSLKTIPAKEANAT
jgi:stress-induced morphogen